nr:uncharacterized protein LOC121821816 [Peromyscus maniculatus bairdii]
MAITSNPLIERTESPSLLLRGCRSGLSWTAPLNPRAGCGTQSPRTPSQANRQRRQSQRVTRRGPGAVTAEACAGLHGRGSPLSAARCPPSRGACRIGSPKPGASGSLSEVARTRSLLPRGGPGGAEQGAASPGVRHDRRSPHCPRRPAPRPRRLRATPLEAPPCRWRPMHRGRRPQVRAESAARRLAEGSETLRAAAAGPGSYL